jgi:hypothetical protein
MLSPLDPHVVEENEGSIGVYEFKRFLANAKPFRPPDPFAVHGGLDNLSLQYVRIIERFHAVLAPEQGI